MQLRQNFLMEKIFFDREPIKISSNRSIIYQKLRFKLYKRFEGIVAICSKEIFYFIIKQSIENSNKLSTLINKERLNKKLRELLGRNVLQYR